MTQIMSNVLRVEFIVIQFGESYDNSVFLTEAVDMYESNMNKGTVTIL